MPGLKARAAAITVAFAVMMPGFAAGPPVDEGPLATLVQIAFAKGFGGPLSGKICTALGITQNNESFPVEQLSSGAGGESRSFNVSRHRGHLDVIIAAKTKEQTLIFLTSAKGDLEKAVVDKQGQPMREIPAADAVSAFEQEKTWWLDSWLKTHYPELSRK